VIFVLTYFKSEAPAPYLLNPTGGKEALTACRKAIATAKRIRKPMTIEDKISARCMTRMFGLQLMQ
jgi:hypothetical protein